ncbi:unnamed protein product [Urochloa decumbens]|uniref:Protein FAR1-RELATED SEQUENCE n=1 Tax=Urochloa decumbens TaxID=240449 RepID=A0ABC9B6K1_9POAL
MCLVTHWEVVPDLNTVPRDDGAESVLGEVPDQVAANSVHSGVGTHVVSGSSGAGNVLMQADSGGLTVPTAETTFSAEDVEDGVEIDTSRESKRTEKKTKYIYVCQRARVNKKEKVATDRPIIEKKIVRQRRRDYVERTRCPARMIVRRTLHGHWEVVHFEKDHNHDRVKKFSLTKYLNSHRNIPPEEREFIRFLHGCNITSTHAFQIMADLYGGIDNCLYTEGDVKNLCVEYQAEYKCKDMKRTLDYFSELQKKDPDFYYSYTLDEEDRVENLFWVDSAARKSYELYGNCISFDATYLTNAYNMPFAPFIGIDRNGITIQLGCGFLRNEKTESYVWLFSEFKNAMGGRDPLNIITDQDLAMKAAITLVFRTAIHRNCRWHIMENARKVLGPFLNGKDELSEDFKNCVSFSFSPAEFESKWQTMLDKHEINGDERWSAEILADDGIEVLGESLQAHELSSSGKHIVRYSRICTDFNKIIIPYMGNDEGYSIVSKHVAAMQADLNEMRKRKASNVASGLQSGQVGQPSGGAGPEGGDLEIRDPPITKRQGRPRERRYKTGLDLVPPKPKPCKYCLSTEHTTTKCPAKPPRK